MEAAGDGSMGVFGGSIDTAATIGRCVSQNHEILAVVSVRFGIRPAPL
jgi:hypothetical protein